MTVSASAKRPALSVIMANYNGAAYLAAAARSVLAQTMADLELIISDDASGDDSLKIAGELARRDPRVRVISTAVNRGPAGARNAALQVATGEWIAIVDSDDLIHPERFERLIALAESAEAEIVADDLLIFQDDGLKPPTTLLNGAWAERDRWTPLETYIEQNRLYGRGPTLGYLKPVIRRRAIEHAGAAYNPDLRIAEDYDFILRLMLGGARMLLTPQLLYHYRKYPSSISHRLSEAILQQMLQADDALADKTRKLGPGPQRAVARRRASIVRALEFERLVAAIKGRSPAKAARAVAARPSILALLARAASERMMRGFARKRAASADPAQVVFLSRQRITDAASGSSAYLLAAAQAFKSQGKTLKFVGVSSAAFGRTPWMRLGPATDVFDSVAVNGSVALGRWRITTRAQVYLGAAIGMIDRVARRTGLIKRSFAKPAPYSVSAPFTRNDQLFVARRTGGAEVLVADYCYLTETLPFALSPGARSAVLVHDVFSTRTAQFEKLKTSDSVDALSAAEEDRMLARADVVAAIQKDEAALLKSRLGDKPVVTAPFPAALVAEAQPGEDGALLFIGSAAAPNVDGLKWFLDECWPDLIASRPGLKLDVVGAVCDQIQSPPQGVILHGRAPDLAGYYARAGVVISPLRAGSGLKIKLIEAMGRGKAMVCTSTTRQGVADETAGCVVEADAAGDFSKAVLRLADAREARRDLGAKALEAARDHFSAEACFGDMAAALGVAPGAERRRAGEAAVLAG
ncbi:glycosyltransferase [Phenylobacterium sp.]|uniref:glycosyltransferase n=1 Tax=Phenylobacterium sp. TaxID=1871053 RepID=UPI0035AF557F